jgi:hypothetical protein
MSGAQCTASLIEIYDVAGGIRSNLTALQDAVGTAQRETKVTAP